MNINSHVIQGPNKPGLWQRCTEMSNYNNAVFILSIAVAPRDLKQKHQGPTVLGTEQTHAHSPCPRDLAI